MPRPLRMPLAILLGLLPCACAAGTGSGGARIEQASACRLPMPAAVAEVRRLARQHDRAGALRVLEAGRPLTTTEPERAWLLVRLWPHACQSARARRAAVNLPPSDIGDALVAVTAEEPERGVAWLATRRARRDGGWRHLAAAVLHNRLGDPERCLIEATRALASQRAFVRQEAHLLRSAALLEDGRLEEALDAARAAHAVEAHDTRPARLLGEIERRRGEIDEAAFQLLPAVRGAPRSERTAHRLAEVLREGVDDQTWTAVDALLADLGSEVDANPELLALAGMTAEALGRPAMAVGHYERALAAGAIAVPIDRRLRRLRFARGEYAEGLHWLRRAIPPDAPTDPHNRLRARWEALEAAVQAAPDAAAGAPRRLALARALLGVGALDEVVAVLGGLEDEASRALRRRVDGHLALEAGLREHVEAGYRASMRKNDDAELDRVLQALRRLAQEHLVPAERAAFADPRRGLREVPLLGAWLDHGTDTSSPIVAHFRRYGRFLMLGQRGGTPPEAIVLALASISKSQPIRTAGRLYRHDVAVGYDRALRAYITAQGGSLGGACIADGLWLDADAARHADCLLRRTLLRDPSYLPAARASGSLPADTLDGPYALTDPGCTATRLLARYMARHPDSPWGSYGTLRAHEFAHVADVRRHLPVLRGLPATIALFVGQGFSPSGVEAEMERRAQIGACVDAPDPDLALAEMLLALPLTTRDPEVHEGGYRNGLRDLVVHIANRPAQYPQIDRSRRIVTQLDRLTNDQIRAAARAVAGP